MCIKKEGKPVHGQTAVSRHGDKSAEFPLTSARSQHTHTHVYREAEQGFVNPRTRQYILTGLSSMAWEVKSPFFHSRQGKEQDGGCLCNNVDYAKALRTRAGAE